MSKYFLGFILGVFTVLIGIIGYAKIWQANELISIEQKTNAILKESEQKNFAPSLNDLNIRTTGLDEKIGSVHKRFDDLYILGGTIVVLLIAINIGIFVRTEDEVEKYFRDNFEVHNKKILGFLAKSADAVAKAEANLVVLENLKNSTTSSTTQPPPGE